MKNKIFYLVMAGIMHYALFIMHSSVYASYVLPYPSYMPGNTMYNVSRLMDKVKQCWYWGNIAKVKYHLGLSDKYLVEAKTLFEYKQYLLGADALTRSTKEFEKLPALVLAGEKEGKDMTPSISIIVDASDEHKRVLESMKKESPSEFRWTPEKTSASDLPLHRDIDNAAAVTDSVSGDAGKLK